MSEKLIIKGLKPTKGEVTISGAKNSVLKLMAASLLTKDTCIIYNVPDLSDVEIMLEVLRELGAKTKYDKNLKKIINLLCEYSSDIESYLSSKNVSCFLDRLEVEEKNHINTLEQLEEEIKKIKLIESDSNWKSAIERAENKEILNGKVSILWCDGGDKDIE